MAKGHASDTISVLVTETEQGAGMALDITDLLFDAPDDVKLKSFEHIPIIHDLLCQHTHLQDYCTEHQHTHKEVASATRGEFVAIQKLLAGKMSAQNQSI